MESLGQGPAKVLPEVPSAVPDPQSGRTISPVSQGHLLTPHTQASICLSSGHCRIPACSVQVFPQEAGPARLCTLHCAESCGYRNHLK